MAKRNNSVNWEAIEREYLAGEDSIREIADRYEVSDTAIRKRAKEKKWVRLVRTPPKVRTSANCELGVRTSPPPPSDPDEPREPTTIADQGRNLVGRMLDELDTITSHPSELHGMIIAATQDDADDARQDALLKAISLPSRAGTMKTLALALKTLNEASAPQGKKAAQQEKANKIAGVSRFAQLGPPTLKAVK